jgi:hypothetical protein
LELADRHEFWNCTLDGLAVLRDRNLFRVYKLQRPVAELAVVADSFHTKPLLRILQSADRYQVLAVNRHEIKLYEGNRDVPPAHLETHRAALSRAPGRPGGQVQRLAARRSRRLR